MNREYCIYSVSGPIFITEKNKNQHIVGGVYLNETNYPLPLNVGSFDCWTVKLPFVTVQKNMSSFDYWLGGRPMTIQSKQAVVNPAEVFIFNFPF